MPNSVLWIGLVAMWLFVLFPMLADRHPRIRQTTDTALSTRVLHRGGMRRKPERGPAAGHESDPDWQPTRNRNSRDLEAEDQGDPMDTKSTELDTLSASVPSDQHDAGIRVRRGRGGFDPEADAIARAARYQFRQRAVLAIVLAAVMSGALALIVSGTLWWLCAASGVVLVTYLAYLRRQVRMEEEIRRRRMARLTRSRLGVEVDHRRRTPSDSVTVAPPGREGRRGRRRGSRLRAPRGSRPRRRCHRARPDACRLGAVASRFRAAPGACYCCRARSRGRTGL